MALINVKDVSISFGHPPLLESVNLTVEAGERVCVVGRNGAGKTTLLKLLSGEVTADSGEVERRQGLRVSGLPQNVPEDLEGTCLEVVTGEPEGLETIDERSLRAEAVISRLELDPQSRVETLSGGLKRRVLLAQALVDEPDLLLLDEPTNHLDIESITWLEKFLLKYKGTLVFITHDRVFLQKLAGRIVDLDNGALTSWPGDYASYLKKKQEALQAQQKQNARFDRKLAEEEVWIRQGVRERRTRNEGRVRELLKMREVAGERRSRMGSVKIEMQEAGRTGKRIVKAEGVTFGYGEGTGEAIVKNLSAVVYRGDKVGIIGPNGCGKTTLLGLLLGRLTPVEGEVTMGEGVEVAYLDQLRDQLDMDRTVIENVIEAGDKVIVNGRPKHIVSYLRDFLFSSDRAKTPVWVLSGGERNRLLLAKLFTKPSNVLVLDEPTNDLDAETLELLEERLLEFGGTVLLVSHDRAFLNNVVTSTMVFEGDGSIGEYAGGYDDWQKQRAPKPEKVSKLPAKQKARKPKSDKPRKLTFKEKFELQALPAKIEELEQEQSDLHAKMSDPEFYKSEGEAVSTVTARLETLESELLQIYERWEELEAIAEAAGR